VNVGYLKVAFLNILSNFAFVSWAYSAALLAAASDAAAFELASDKPDLISACSDTTNEFGAM
jgi:hypothetical protein